MKKLTLLALSALTTLSTLAAPSFAARDQPPIRLIVPYTAGGPIDVTARILAEGVRDTLGPVIIENKPGAGGNIGSDAIAKARPDGRVIGIAALASHAVNPWLYSKMPYDAAKDFAPITLMVRIPNVLVMGSATAEKLQINTLHDLIEYARKNPGQLNYGSGGNGSAGHLAGEMFKRQADVAIEHIPYSGGAPAQLALMSGQIHFNVDNLATAAPNIRNGKLKAIAVTTLARSPVLPDVPTMNESGLQDFEVDTWWGLVAPADTPKETIDTLNKAFTAAMTTPQAKERFAALLTTPEPTSAEQFGQLLNNELQRYEKIVREAGAKVD